MNSQWNPVELLRVFYAGRGGVDIYAYAGWVVALFMVYVIGIRSIARLVGTEDDAKFFLWIGIFGCVIFPFSVPAALGVTCIFFSVRGLDYLINALVKYWLKPVPAIKKTPMKQKPVVPTPDPYFRAAMVEVERIAPTEEP